MSKSKTVGYLYYNETKWTCHTYFPKISKYSDVKYELSDKTTFQLSFIHSQH